MEQTADYFWHVYKLWFRKENCMVNFLSCTFSILVNHENWCQSQTVNNFTKIFTNLRKLKCRNKIMVRLFMVFNATFNNISVISWQSVLLLEETGVPRENHWLVAIIKCKLLAISWCLFDEKKRNIIFSFPRLTTLCDKVCQWLATSRWFSLGTPVSSNNKTDIDYITEILLKVGLNTINWMPREYI
jgi:hypothetical protein